MTYQEGYKRDIHTCPKCQCVVGEYHKCPYDKMRPRISARFKFIGDLVIILIISVIGYFTFNFVQEIRIEKTIELPPIIINEHTE